MKPSAEPPTTNDPMSVDAILQLIRGLTTAQVRQQLEHDEQHNLDRLFYIYHFFLLARER
jgi:hypothetical protein